LSLSQRNELARCELYRTESGMTPPDSSPNTGSGIDPALCSTKSQPLGDSSRIDHCAFESPPMRDQ